MGELSSPFVEMEGLGKSFFGRAVLSDINLRIFPGTIHGLVGENGAGKSTLGKLIAGSYAPDAGQMRVNGSPVCFSSPASALNFGVAGMQQEIALAGDLTALENVMLGRERTTMGIVRSRSVRLEFDLLLRETQFDIDPDAVASDLPLAKQQQLEILRALARNAKLVVMDEPTAALPQSEVEHLHNILKKLRDRGVAIVYVSHFLEHVMDMCDEITVLRNGHLIETRNKEDWTKETLVASMLGKPLEANYPVLPALPENSEIRLDVKELSDGNLVENMNFAVRRGEIVGFFGLAGSGRSETMHAIYGAGPLARGEIRLDGEIYVPRSPNAAISCGIALLPESRKDQGLFLDHGPRFNTVLNMLRKIAPRGFILGARETSQAAKSLDEVAAAHTKAVRQVAMLSGGNQQKVLLAKTLYSGPSVLILDEPTRGVDVGARRQIYEVIVQLVENGMSVLLVSSDIDEALAMSHRLCVVRNGRVMRQFESSNTPHAEVLNAAFGVGAID